LQYFFWMCGISIGFTQGIGQEIKRSRSCHRVG
jgi:hypothetical protein